MKEPIVTEIELDKHFPFMYKNFIISSQQKLYLLLEENEGILDLLCFNSLSIYKYGYPNDEIGHHLMKYGLGFYRFFEVKNSEWIGELGNQNSSHPIHSDSIFSDDNHYIARFKDVTLEVVSESYELIQMTRPELTEIINEQLNNIKNNS